MHPSIKNPPLELPISVTGGRLCFAGFVVRPYLKVQHFVENVEPPSLLHQGFQVLPLPQLRPQPKSASLKAFKLKLSHALKMPGKASSYLHGVPLAACRSHLKCSNLREPCA